MLEEEFLEMLDFNINIELKEYEERV